MQVKKKTKSTKKTTYKPRTTGNLKKVAERRSTYVVRQLGFPAPLIYKRDLRPIHNLKATIREIRDYFAGNVTGITRDETIAQTMLRLLFCKIVDEQETAANSNTFANYSAAAGAGLG
jgi:hypothetical protein